MDPINILLAVLLLILGAGYPLFAIWRLSVRLSRKERTLTSLEMILQFVLLAAIPLAAMLGGFSLLIPSLWESAVIRVVVYASTAVAIGTLVAQLWITRAERKRRARQV